MLVHMKAPLLGPISRALLQFVVLFHQEREASLLATCYKW